jgi:hypothetical protein
MTFIPPLALFLTVTLVHVPVDGFRVDCSPEHTYKTYIKREQQPNQLRKDDKQLPKAFTSQDRTWRFPETSSVRPIGDTRLPTLTDQDRLWRLPDPKQLRHTSTTMGTYTDQDRMWRNPHDKLTRHQAQLPDPFKDDERFWWKDDKTFQHLLLEEVCDELKDGDQVCPQPLSEPSKTLFRRPLARLSRHPHSFDDHMRQLDADVVSTMTEDDRLGWLTENTHKLLLEEEGRFLDE